ncbi:hypothetical protein HYO05_23075 [Vibrio parahaemolyticus]|uniref:hypothetical protein n=1 Tax=Vibrio parahaemolyticus TaxID=670 RepID=UPI00158745E8|nr:hypothetical protein [Vibrio parahaemolyticus]EGQ8047248.1 hypothetical protein [Vibrio parahaemolyticus]EHH2867134.1 hypothetical protein [Vibrio parahaemolyticus]MBM5036977.1 hypothetical protein [Vibrio parahaemolyticus]MBM5050650.1 hypothetical protein [Vibrio parahaemolyticus]MBM5078070.1 hypothetical protein [Vibrio parahaemolyticus]
MSFVLFLVWFAVSEADSLVESQLCDIVFSNELFGVVSPFSTALFVPSGFSDSRFETAPDLSFSKHTKTVLAKRQSISVWQLTKHSRGIHNAWQFWFESTLVFTVQ